jgi:hypothetical protein
MPIPVSTVRQRTKTACLPVRAPFAREGSQPVRLTQPTGIVPLLSSLKQLAKGCQLTASSQAHP